MACGREAVVYSESVHRATAVSLVTISAVLAGVKAPSSSGHTHSAVAGRTPPEMPGASVDYTTAFTCSERSLLPAYFYPGSNWQAALSTASAGSSFIVNPSNGPGGAPDANYVQTVDDARASGAVLWGYINTFYASSPLSSLSIQIADYRNWYGITNIFFDDASSSASQVGYYAAAGQAVRAEDPGASVMLNPGTYPNAAYAALGDTLVVFEGNYTSFLADRPPSWVASEPSSMFASLVSAVPASDVTSALALSRERNNGYIYLTDHVDVPTLYQQLPSYWSTEVADLSNPCGTSPPASGAGAGSGAASGSVAGAGSGAASGSGAAAGVGAIPVSGESRGPVSPTAGYRLVGADGGVFSFGDAGFYGSAGGMRLNSPVVGIVATPDGRGYWLVGADGGVFSFGDAGFYGSAGGMRLNAPVVGAG